MALEAKPAAYDHLTEEALEDYAFGRLRYADLENFEEHLLLCGHCRERLNAEDDFAEAMLALAAMESFPSRECSASPVTPHRLGFLGTLDRAWEFLTENAISRTLRGVPLWGAAVVVLVAASFPIAVWRTPRPVQTAEAVELKTMRGGGDESVAEASRGRTLELSIDLGTLTNTVGEIGLYRLEVVDAVGNRVWTTAAISPVSGQLKAKLENGLFPGIYWARLYTDSGKLLREFSLHIR